MRLQLPASFRPAILFIFLLLPWAAHADALADFSGGLGDSTPNQFAGTAGQGWIDGWSSFFSHSPDNFSFEVGKDAVNVLKISRKGDEGFARIFRILDSPESGPAAPQEVSFQIRVDEFTGSAENPFLITIMGSSQEFKKSPSPQNSVWCLVVAEREQSWAIHHGDGIDQLLRLNTKVPLEPGVVYSIKIRTRPDEQSFQVFIESATASYESPMLKSPNPSATADLISFGGWVAQNGPGDFRWSLGPVAVRHGDPQ